jgi:hypothetical protein
MPEAHLYPNGNAIFYDPHGAQLTDMQECGLLGLIPFMERYPDATVYWAVWKKWAHKMHPEEVRGLVRMLRERG